MFNLLVSVSALLAFSQLSFAHDMMNSESTNVAGPVGGLDNALMKIQRTPFPQWLTDFTGLSEWPGINPPYIPLDFINHGQIPNYRPYQQSTCGTNPRDSCSFDCDKCIDHDDISTCSKLSQTFDDGPTEATRDLLQHLNHKTTFFTLGINVVSHPEIYQEILDAGHLVGTHTWSHPFLPSLSNEEIIAQIQWSIWAMNATGNHLPKWFRPPYGGIDNRVRAITRQFGLQAVLWDYDTFDWMMLADGSTRTEEHIYNDVRQWNSNTPKRGLILEHDGSARTVNVGKGVSDIIGPDQLTVAECVGGVDYITTFGPASSQLGAKIDKRDYGAKGSYLASFNA